MRTFYILLGNTLLTSVANMTVWFAITFFSYLQTQSVLVTSVLSGLYLVATAATGVWFGSLVDHHRKKTSLLISSLISFLLYSIALLIYTFTPIAQYQDSSGISIWILILLCLCGVIVGNIRSIVTPTLTTILVPEADRDKANGVSGTISGIGFLVTSVISGILVGHSGMTLVLILGIVCNLLAAFHVALTTIPELPHDTSHDQHGRMDLRGTLQVVRGVPGLLPLIIFSMWNNFLGGVFMSLMDAYGLSLVSVETWGFLWGIVSLAFIVGGLLVAKFGVGKNPVRSLFLGNFGIWSICCVFTLHPSILPMIAGIFVYLTIVPLIEASEQTVLQKVVPAQRQGRVFGFAQTVEQSASPLTAFFIGPITQFLFVPFMTTGLGATVLGPWFGTGQPRAIALVFTIAGALGLLLTLAFWRSRFYTALEKSYRTLHA